MTDRKEYNRLQKAKRRAELSADIADKSADIADKSADTIGNVDKLAKTADISLFAGKGRGVPVNGYVLIAGNAHTPDRVVTELAWRARLNTRCSHMLDGWACKLH